MKHIKNVKKYVHLGSALGYLNNDSGLGSLKQVI